MIYFNSHKRPATLEEIERFEKVIGVRLPEDYREYLASGGGGASTRGEYAFKMTKPGILENDDVGGEALLEYLLSAAASDGEESDLMASYKYMNSPDREFNYLPQDMIVIGEAPGGSYVLLGIKGDRRGKVYFWDSNLFPLEDFGPETYENISYVADSFSEFLSSLYPFGDS